MKKWWLGLMLFMLPVAVTGYGKGNVPIPVTPQQEGKVPLVLTIPKINVSATVEQVGFGNNQDMGVPVNTQNVGWWKYGAKLNENGSVVIDGHVNLPGKKRGVFADLNKMKIGDEMTVMDTGGQVYVYRVEGMSTYNFERFPVEFVFKRQDKPRLNLITCDGKWNGEMDSFDKRLVVFATYEGI